jgi:hypothetical protein
MNATAVHTNGAFVQEDTVIIELTAPAAVPTGGPFFQVTRLLRTVGERLIEALGANHAPIEDAELDYTFYGPCGCC